MRYLKQYERPIPFGRDQGYPETVTEIYSNMRDLARAHNPKQNATYAHIQTVDPANFQVLIDIALEEEAQRKIEEERQKKEAEFLRLAKELGKEV